jgi:D-arginine dehydrogenase
MQLKVVVVGGGIAGVSAAYYLGRAGAAVTLLEGEESLAFHSTGRSAALYFENYGAEANRPLTRASRAFFDAPPEGMVDHLLLRNRGALWIGRPEQMAPLRNLQQSTGERARWLEPDQAAELVPTLRTDRMAGAVLEPEALDMDVAAIHQGFVRGMRVHGVEVLTRSPVSGLEIVNGCWVAMVGDRRFESDVIVNAAGAWCDQVGDMAGAMRIGLQPMRRTAFMVPGDASWSDWPLVSNIDNEFYFRPDGTQLLCSLAEENPTEPCDARPDQIDIALAIDRINTDTNLQIRTVRSSWTGLRSFVADRAMVIGFDPVVPGFFWLAGQGGTGIQTSPAAGELTAALVVERNPPGRLLEMGLDIGALSPGRLTKPQPR